MYKKIHLQGVAHAGLGAGAERLTRTAIPKVIQLNILEHNLEARFVHQNNPKVSEVLSSHPDYDLLITGYSLGAGRGRPTLVDIEKHLAGLAQLVALKLDQEQLLPSQTKVTVIGRLANHQLAGGVCADGLI